LRRAASEHVEYVFDTNPHATHARPTTTLPWIRCYAIKEARAHECDTSNALARSQHGTTNDKTLDLFAQISTQTEHRHLSRLEEPAECI
jgi:hypothetical protein